MVLRCRKGEMNKNVLTACVFLALAITFGLIINLSTCCNEAVCASIVSKCLLTQSCKCDLKNCSCCKDCSNCLNYLYTECCSCVNMCPQPNVTETELYKKSHVEELADPIPALFDVLTQEKDQLLRWVTYTFPAHQDLAIFSPDPGKEIKFATVSSDGDTEIFREEVNCTVAYMSQCMSWNKCKSSCRSMGASSYRWFHDGCCECIGTTCLNYGIKESRCLNCPPTEDNNLEEDEVAIDDDTEDSMNNDLSVDDVPKKKL